MDLVKLNRNGQVSVPGWLRKKLSLKTGDFFRVEEDPFGKIVLTPVTVAEKKFESGLDLKKYEREGVDIGLLVSNLSRTPTERAENNRAMLEFIEEAKKNWVRH